MAKEFERQLERLLNGFEPSFEFEPVDPLPAEEFEGRVKALRREATIGEYDALILHSDPIGWYHTSNPFLRYLCDWIREGVLIVPTDNDQPATLLTFYGSEVLFPPPGEPTWVEDVRQVGLWGREQWARPGDPAERVSRGVASVLEKERNLGDGRFAILGDQTSAPYWDALREYMPRSVFEDRTEYITRMQRVRSPREQALVRGAAQLIDIGVQAAQYVTRPGVTDHEIYAAFTYAQLARGGETGDGYQIGVNQYGTHVSKPYGHIVRPGDVVQLYLSQITYRGYDAQAARMIIVGETTDEHEELIAMCIDGVERAMAVAKPGVAISEVNAAGFEPYLERGLLTTADGRTMPYSWDADPNGEPRPFPLQRVDDPDWDRQGRSLLHVYPATRGPIAPRLGHSVSMAGTGGYAIISTNEDRLEPGMTLVVHTQWFEPLKMGCNIGHSLLVTEDGIENLNAETSLAPHRVPV